MDDTKAGGNQQSVKETAETTTDKPRKGLMGTVLKILAIVVLLVIGALVAQGAGLMPPIISLEDVSLKSLGQLRKRAAFLFGVKDTAAITNPPHAVFSRIASADLMSTGKLLGTVGRSPVDPSRVLFAAFEKSVLPNDSDGPKSCPPGPIFSAEKTEESTADSPADDAPGAVQVASIPASKDTEPAALEEEKTEAPAQPAKAPEAPKSRTGSKKEQKDRSPKTKAPEPGSDKSDKNTKLPQVTTREKQAKPQKPEPDGVEPGGAMTASEAEKRPEKYQLPGSLLINVENYKGSMIKWGLMTVLDDSRSMARQVKPWDPNRMSVAQEILGRIPRILTPGSRLAVRDFYCGGGKGKGKRRRRCLSHMLFPWAAHPFDGLKERLESAAPGGINNPCAAAAFTLKKDFAGIGEVVPRVLLITGGATRCSYRNVLQAVDSKGARGRVRVDVIALGMGKRRQRGYSILAKKSRGVFLRADKPSDVDAVIAKYEKSLKTPSMKKLDVIGEKSSFKVSNGEEITLAPGAYKISLPPIRGLDPEKRTIERVEVNSGENSILKIRIKKGRLFVKAEKR